MSDMIVFWTVAAIIFFVVKNNKKKLSEAQKKQQQARVDAQINQTSPGAPRGSVSKTEQRFLQSMGTQMPQTKTGPAAPVRQAVRTAAAAEQRPAEQTEEDEQSTTEMLAEKAKQDQIEHQKEKLEQAQYEKKYYGNYHYAKRYLLGDPVPATERLIYCPNCAAENLIRITDNPKKFNCYFCREKLE